MGFGYTGKYCVINLSTRTTETVEPGDDFYRKYLGGYGMGAAVIGARQPAGIDPLAPESHLGFCAGLLSGTGCLFSGRFMVVGKSPLTGGWGDANAGGSLSREIKRTGFDAVFVTGASETPVWIHITEEKIEFCDASELWGKDINGTEDAIGEATGVRKVQIASIGPAGENRSLISGISTDRARIAARSGLGAVMGSKNLKAIAFRGRAKTHTARPEQVKAINKGFMTQFKKSSFMDRFTIKIMGPLSKLIARTGINVPAKPTLVKEIYRRYGTSGLTTYSAMTGDMPIKNWGGVGYKDYSYTSASKNSDEQVIQYQKKRYACQGCPLGCGGIIDIKKGQFKGKEGHKPEYETLGAFGGMLLMDDLDAIIELNEMCNRAGIDTISTGGVLAFAIECFENGVIGESETGGLKLGWGRTREILALAGKIIHREGFGDILADGVKVAAEKIGNGAEQFAVHAGGQELPMHDSRLDPGFAIAYQCEPTPGRHTISCYLYAGLFGLEKRFPGAAAAIKKAKGRTEKEVRRYAAGSCYMQLVNCGGMCLFGAITAPLPVVEYMNAVTGWDMTPDQDLEAGERILSLRKAFNMREGIGPKDHFIHGRAVGSQPLESGPLKGKTIDIDELTAAFFSIMGWQTDTCGPSPERMKALGIDILK